VGASHLDDKGLMKSKKTTPPPAGQMELLDPRPAVVHFWDKDEALRTGRLVKKIKRGKRKGQFVVVDSTGRRQVGPKIRNLE
jgi:hypothetical protein